MTGRRIAALAVLVMLAGAQPAHAQRETIRGEARAADGDSLRLADRRIRLAGIDAPELNQSCETAQGHPWRCGREALAGLRRLVQGETVTCELVGRRSFGRDLATCQADGRDLGKAQIEAGLALAYGRSPPVAYARAEREARRAKRGIWQGRFEDPAAVRRD